MAQNAYANAVFAAKPKLRLKVVDKRLRLLYYFISRLFFCNALHTA